MAKVSKKLRNKCLNAVSEICHDVTNEELAEWIDSPPEEWDKETKELFDLIASLEIKITRKLMLILSV